MLDGVDEYKTMQILSDLIDTFEGGLGKAAETGAACKEFLEGDRFKKFMSNIERNIKGPFFFGEKPSVVDFVLVALVDSADAASLAHVWTKTGSTAWSSYAKIDGVIAGIRALESYKALNAKTVTLKADYCKPADDEWFAAWN